MTLATANEKKQPHVMTLLFTHDDDYSMYFVTHTDSKKTSDIETNPLVGGEIHEVGSWYIQFHGHAERLDEKHMEQIMERLTTQASKIENFWPPIFLKIDESYSAFKITPTWMRLMDISHETISTNPAPIYTIIE